MHFIFSLAVIIALALLLATSLFLLGAAVLPTRGLKARAHGMYVAEAWLSGESCAEVTLYRQRFRSRPVAAVFARLLAAALDLRLLAHHRDAVPIGHPAMRAHELSIQFGVRKLTPSEQQEGVRAVWLPVLPSRPGYAGARASAP